jgi:hypothetical protein
MGLSMNRVLVALYPPEKAGALVILARSICDRMDGNAYFPSPVPSLAKVRKAIVALEDAAAVAESKKRGTATARDKLLSALRSLLTRLKAYVQGMADDNPEHAVAMIESAGMSVQPKGQRTIAILAVRRGRVSGEVRLVAKAVAKLATYFWQMSEDDRATWIDLPKTLQAKTGVKNLEPGHTYWFRFRALTRRGTGEWCDPVAIIAN